MPRETSTQVVSAFVAAIEGKDLDSALALVTEDVVYDNVPLGEVRGPEGIRAALARILTSAERVEWLVHHQVGEADVVMNERLDRFLLPAGGSRSRSPACSCCATGASRCGATTSTPLPTGGRPRAPNRTQNLRRRRDCRRTQTGDRPARGSRRYLRQEVKLLLTVAAQVSRR